MSDNLIENLNEKLKINDDKRNLNENKRSANVDNDNNNNKDDNNGQECLLNNDKVIQKYFIISKAGKPIYYNEELHLMTRKNKLDMNMVNNLINLVGLLKVIISNFENIDQQLEYIEFDKNLKISFIEYNELIYVYVSNLNESYELIKLRLSFIHNNLLSIIPKNKLIQIFRTHSNYDLRNLLDGSEILINSFIKNLQYDFNYYLLGIQPYKLPFNFRNTVSSLMKVPKGSSKYHLYTVIFAFGKVVTILRPKNHSIHPLDLFIILNTLNSTSNFKHCQSWFPLSLPKSFPNGFLHCYVAFEPPSENFSSREFATDPQVGVICLSSDPQGFESISKWWNEIKFKMHQMNIFDTLYSSYNDSHYTCGDVSVPGLRHFIFKSRSNVQITSPIYDQPYENDIIARQRLLNTYDDLFNRVRSSQLSNKTNNKITKSGNNNNGSNLNKSPSSPQLSSANTNAQPSTSTSQKPNLKQSQSKPDLKSLVRIPSNLTSSLITLTSSALTSLQPIQPQPTNNAMTTRTSYFVRNPHESVLVWSTRLFELYIALPPSMPRSAAINSAQSLLKWIRKEERNLFLGDTSTF